MSQEDLDVHLPDLELAIGVIGGRWKTTILAHLARRPLRFGALRRTVSGISEKVLMQQLRELEADRMIARAVFPTVPPRVEYSLTPHARSLCHVIQAIAAWGGYHRRQVGAAGTPKRRRASRSA